MRALVSDSLSATVRTFAPRWGLVAWLVAEFSTRKLVLPIPFYGDNEINVGGALIPLGIALVMWALDWRKSVWIAVLVSLVTWVSYQSSDVSVIGIEIDTLSVAFGAAIGAICLAPSRGPSVAFISSTVGILIGSDLLRGYEGAPVFGAGIIGGDGLNDAVFCVGIYSVMIALFLEWWIAWTRNRERLS